MNGAPQGWPAANASPGTPNAPSTRALGATALQLCTVPETCAMLRVSRWQVYQLINKRELGSIKIGRRRLIPLEAIEAYLAKRPNSAIHGALS